MVNFGVPKELIITKKKLFKKIDFQNTLKGIERAFQKRGFEAKFYPHIKEVAFNTYILTVKRIK